MATALLPKAPKNTDWIYQLIPHKRFFSITITMATWIVLFSTSRITPMEILWIQVIAGTLILMQATVFTGMISAQQENLPMFPNRRVFIRAAWVMGLVFQLLI